MNSLNSELTRVGAPANVLRRALITLALLTTAALAQPTGLVSKWTRSNAP